MPQFPHSRYTTGQSTGAFVRAQGSHSPSIEVDIGEVISIPEDHPFKVKFVQVSGAWHFKVVPGTVNSFTPTLDGTKLDANPAPTKSVGTTVRYVYLECQYSAGNAFPYDVKVKIDTSVPFDTEEFAHVAIARIDATGASPKKLSQPVETSLWGERLKCGTEDAEYFFARS